MTLQRSMIVSSGPSIIDIIPNTDVDRGEDGRFLSMDHLLGAKCPCKPDKVLAHTVYVAGVTQVQFVHRNMRRA